MAKRPRRSKKRKRRRRRDAPAVNVTSPSGTVRTAAVKHRASQQWHARRREQRCLLVARFWIIAAPVLAMTHAALGWLDTVAFGALTVTGIAIGLTTLAWGLLKRRATLLLTGLACVAMLPLLFTVRAQGDNWLRSGTDWASLGLAMLFLVIAGLHQFLMRLANGRPSFQLRSGLWKLASHFKGEFVSEYPRVTFVDREKRIVVAPHTIDREQNRLYLEVVAPWPDRELRLELFPAGTFSRVKSLIGMQDVPIGDMVFDRAFEISSNSPQKCDQLLQPNVREKLESLRRDDHDFCFSIVGCHFVVRVNVLIGDQPLIDATRDILRMYRAVVGNQQSCVEAQLRSARTKETTRPETAAVQFLEPVVIGVTCQICGGLIEGEHAECRRCRTPHHLDCWDYMGECSTYACRNSSYRRRKSL